MNKNNIKILFVSFLLLMVMGSCKKDFFYNGINQDPGSVTQNQLPPKVLLNGAELSVGYSVGGDISRYTAMFLNSVVGNNRQFATYQKYIFTAQDFGNLWANIYEQGLNNQYILKQLSAKKGYAYYEGISNVLLAYEYGLTTDLWGDIPRSSALQGNQGTVQPPFDKQQDIYPYLQSILDSAIIQFGGSGGSLLPGVDDFIFGGKAANWIAFANGLKARYYLHLSKVDNAYATKTLASINAALSGSPKTAAVPFFNNETQANPWYQYIEQRSDISYKNSFLADTLRALGDPRLDAYIVQADDVLSDLFAAIDAPVVLMSKTEMLFIKAEALSALNDPTAAAIYDAAVSSSFADAGLSVPAGYLVDHALVGATHASRLPIIIFQKYIALFTQPEPFNDWRRTGYPGLVPNNGSGIPRRFLYPQSELDYNGANVPAGMTLFSKVWWDQ
jgi:hypothetical protein